MTHDAGPTVGTVRLRLPAIIGIGERPTPSMSPHLAHAVGRLALGDDDSDAAAALEMFETPCLHVPPTMIPELLDRLEDRGDRIAVDGASAEFVDAPAGSADFDDARSRLTSESVDDADVVIGESVKYFAEASRFVRFLLSQQRVVPMLVHEAADPAGGGAAGAGALRGAWHAWLADEPTLARLSVLAASMPAAVRAVHDSRSHDGWLMLESFIHRLCDQLVRSVFIRETLIDAIDGRDPSADAHVAWLCGLLGAGSDIETSAKVRSDLIKGVRRWIGGLDERGAGAPWRLVLRLSEPIDLSAISDTGVPGDGVRWTLVLGLQSTSRPEVSVDAADLWVLPGGGSGSAIIEGERVEAPGEVLLSELGRASRLYKRLESCLDEPEPTELELNTTEAYRFLREIKPVLEEQGISVQAPGWWNQPTLRLGARMIVESEDVDLSAWSTGVESARPGSAGGVARIGLNTLIDYRWQIAVGDVSLTLEQFERLAAQHAPLVLVNGRWVEIRPEDVRAAVRFIRENPGGRMEIGKALRLAYASDPEQTGVSILGMESTGWVNAVFGDSSKNFKLPVLPSPKGFIGTLRPYQLKGLSWLAFLDRFGLGACLADDMGLGKTVQLLALLAHERAVLEERGAGEDRETPVAAPTLLVVPMSVVPNWLHEAQRFTPRLRVLIHHGPERQSGSALVDAALASDMVVTTYALAHRDREDLSRVPWSRMVLDEAQNIKNPGAKQTRAIRGIDAPRKIALTGTPVENRLGELWSIMDFLNAGYLGSTGDFRKRFGLPIERYHDRHRSQQLRGLVQPFILRRLKSDPNVISDLPEKVESKEFCYLTPEQARLYQSCVSDMLAAAERSEGIQRRGLVLAGLIRLKQICNHPAQFLRESAQSSEADGSDRTLPQISRSGKCQRLVEMLDEVVAAGDKALVFTQFRQMGLLLAGMLRRSLDREVLFLHGGTPTHERQRMIDEFQGRRAERDSGAGGPPIFILSLKAGGVGLNLTAASHVFHFDRWWNPAVEAQATDRAYRIGQTRSVQVHKFVVAGTLEERIDEMIEAKTELANEIIGSGEDWLTDLSTTQLRDLLTLRSEAVVEGVDA
ncbi:MAG: DEAD/DEAH box helicase [Phycisphaeraceae bacterium]|nr:DEAD/DEAH box helicase [Phycisphaeraceae bacterium]